MAAEKNTEKFMAVTGADRDVAVRFLEACAGNLDMAVGMHMDNAGVNVSNSSQQAFASADSNLGDDVRAPIPQRTQVLVEADTFMDASWSVRRQRQRRSVFDGFRNFQDETCETLKGKKQSKKRSLEELYRPPVDITFKGTFQSARDAGSAQNKWLLINVQNVQEFSCQLLNRDVWSSLLSRNLIKDHFIFWQVYNDSEEGSWFLQFYHVTKWPYVAVIDPFTGEKQIVWDKISDGCVFSELVEEFISMYPVPDNSLSSPALKRMRTEPSIVDATEQEQMEAAIQASLTESKTTHYVYDSDCEADAGTSSDVEPSYSDSFDIVFSSQPGPSHRIFSAKLSSNSNPKSEQYQQPLLSSSSSSSLPQICTYKNSPISTGHTIPELTSRKKETRRTDNEAKLWSMTPSSQTGLDSDLNTDSSLIDMIGCREAEVSTPNTNTSGEDSLSDSQLSTSDREVAVPSKSVYDTSDREVAVPSKSVNILSAQKGIQDNICWTDYWGHPSDKTINIMVRFPNNKKEQIQIPCTSQIKALTAFCCSLGFPEDKFELVTNYPRRRLSQMASNMSLQQAGLHEQETVFVQDL